MNGIFVGLGANLGDREQTIRTAIAQLERLPDTAVRRVSSLFDTDPVGPIEQPSFLNAVVELSSELSPRELLWHLLLIERRLGRVREGRWGPRVIDLDLLLYGAEVIDEDDLTVPHPELVGRAFVLVPLAELEPRLVHPVEARTIRELLHDLGDPDTVRPRGRFWYQDVR